MTTEKKCENCKFWKPPNPEEDWECDENGDVIHDNYGSCNKVYHKNSYKNEHDPDAFEVELAHVVDGSGYFAELRTLPDFYCCLYEEKP